MTNTETPAFQTLEEIRMRKALLRKDIQACGGKIDRLSHSLFQRPAAVNRRASAGQRISSALNYGAGLLDAIILGFRLYRKFKK